MSAIHDFPDLQQQQQPPGGAGIGAPPHRRRRRRRRGRSAARRRRPVFSSEPATATGAATTDGGGGGSSFGGLSDSDAQSSARLDSECGSSGIFSYNHSRMESSSSDDEIDLESGELEMKVHCGGGGESEKKQCRICHLNFEVCGGGAAEEEDEDDGGGGGGDAIELGCNCKGDLGTAHKQCAETWFKIRGNMTCEICGAIAQNVGGEQTNETSNAAIDIEAADQLVAAAMAVGSEPQNFWQGRRIMNILLGCMVFAFIISWLFHFNVLP